TPDSRSSTYSSTSLCVFPVPALAQTTVLLSNDISLHTSCTADDNRSHYTPAGRQAPDETVRSVLSQRACRFGPEVLRILWRRSHAKRQACWVSEAANSDRQFAL